MNALPLPEVVELGPMDRPALADAPPPSLPVPIARIVDQPFRVSIWSDDTLVIVRGDESMLLEPEEVAHLAGFLRRWEPA